MALRNQPYIPLYVQDVLTDEKLVECSASSHGVYMLLICILHKQENYGLLLLKQKYKQIESKYQAFACMLAKQMPFDAETIQKSLYELHDERVIDLDENELFQKRMVKDGKLSISRTENGKKGGAILSKQYGKQGFLYLMSDGFTKNKIGISTNPKNRLYRIRCDLKLPKNFEVQYQVPVTDMGASEDYALDFFKDIKDGEWLIGDFVEISKRFVLLEANIEAKVQANTEATSEYEYENEINISNNNNFLFKDTLEKNKIWIKSISTQFKITDDEVVLKLNNFYTHLISEFKVHPSMNEFTKHFKNWIPVNKVKNEPNSNSKPNSNSGYKPASVDREKLLRELAQDAATGNIPGDYSQVRTRSQA
jgi:uncharacterized protein YdaU (DUF1376 family)/uncharacterized protein involved in tolerance to divalent cations